MCPPNCNCDDLYWWYDAIASIEGYVEGYEFVIREWLPGQPIPNSRPKTDTLIAAATRTYWQSKQDSIGGLRPDGPSSLILDWPLPPCFHRMYKNIDSIFDDWKILEHDTFEVSPDPRKRKRRLTQQKFPYARLPVQTLPPSPVMSPSAGTDKTICPSTGTDNMTL